MPGSSARSAVPTFVPGGFAPPGPPAPSLARRFNDSPGTPAPRLAPSAALALRRSLRCGRGSLRSVSSLAGLARCLIGIGVGLSAAPACAQGDPPVGVRAAGMAGAFTAVADDASAAVWNPAGLASGSFVSFAIDGNHFNGQSTLFVGFGSPPLAVTYLRSATAEVSNGRNMLVTHNFGVSLVQSLGDTGFAVGTTLKYVRGITSAEAVPSRSSNAFDADVGVLFSRGIGQIGLAVRNAAEPSFAAADGSGGEIRLDRKVRAGASLHVNERTTVAGDVEFTKATTLSGVWRDAAIGVETHPLGPLWLRSGVHWNTAGGQTGAAPIAAFGASYTIRGALMAEGQASLGPAHGNRGWGLGLRFSF